MGTALPAITIGATILGGVMETAGAIQSAQAQQASARYSAQVARNNQIMAERAAKDAEERGKLAERRQRQYTQQLIGRQRVALAANGVDVNVGGALDLQADTAKFGELDALTIRSNAEREAYGYRTQGYNYGAQAAAYKAEAANISPFMSGFSTLLTTGGQVANKWYTYNQAGVDVLSPFRTKPTPGNSYLAGPI